MATDPTAALLERWKDDPGATYRSWFLWEERLKNFRSIRTGIGEVVRAIEAGTFGNEYKGSSLETVVGAIAEQRQIFKGADHAFLWKPKLRIPDIYENVENQRAFGRFLSTCACCDDEDGVLAAVRRLSDLKIKGLGPAAANLLYFLHPTIMPPFNTAIVKGYNALTGARVKLGSWDEYLAMRAGLLRINTEHRMLLSNDLGAVAGFLFDLGRGWYGVPPHGDDAAALAAWGADLERVRAESRAARAMAERERETDATHTLVQGWLRDLGFALGFDVHIAVNDRGREYAGARLAEGCVPDLPHLPAELGIEAVRLIDVLWLHKGVESADGPRVAAAFEVEHSTSIYSGIVRLLDLALGVRATGSTALFLVAPDAREDDVRAQLARPAFARVRDLQVRFIPYGVLEEHRAAMARFGSGLKPIEAVARTLP